MNEDICAILLRRRSWCLPPELAEPWRRMLIYFDRCSLRLVELTGFEPAAAELRFSNDAESIILSSDELLALYAGLRAGAAIDWARLRRDDRTVTDR